MINYYLAQFNAKTTNSQNLPFFLIWLQWNASAHFDHRLHKWNVQIILALRPQIRAENILQILHTARVGQMDPIQVVDFHFNGVECVAGLVHDIQRQNGMRDLVTSPVQRNHVQFDLKIVAEMWQMWAIVLPSSRMWGAIDWRVPHPLQLFRAVFHTSSPHCNRCCRWSPSKRVDLDGHAVQTRTRTGRAGRASSWTCWARFSWKTIRLHRCGPMRLSFRNVQVRWKEIPRTHRYRFASFWLHSNGILSATRHLFRRKGMNNINANDWNE